MGYGKATVYVGRDEYPSFFVDFETVNIADWRVHQSDSDAPLSLPIVVKLKTSAAYDDGKHVLSEIRT